MNPILPRFVRATIDPPAIPVLPVEPAREEDCILSLGEQPVASVDDLHRLLTTLPIEAPTTVTLLRGQRRFERMVLPQEYPHPAPQG